MYAKTMARLRKSAPHLGVQQELVDQVIQAARRPKDVESKSYSLNLHLLACICESVITHLRYLEDNRSVYNETRTEASLRKFQHVAASTLNYQYVLESRAHLTLACLRSEPHVNPYSGEHNGE